jgi:perosamine synthetase
VNRSRAPRRLAGDPTEDAVTTPPVARSVADRTPPKTRFAANASLPSERIPLSAPALIGNELEYVKRCLDSTWISRGDFVEAFEQKFAELCGVNYAVAVCNGTAALHLALLGLGVSPGDEVIVPSLTYVATANAVAYCGATPVFADSEPNTWNVDPTAVDAAATHRTVGIIAVHLYGHPAEMNALRAIARRRGLFLLEDAAQAHGACFGGKPVGSLGDAGTFSFFGGKLVTSGEGGIVVTDDTRLAEVASRLRNHGHDPARRYHVTQLGFNYRLTNVAAAIGLAQLENFQWHVARRRENAARYRSHLEGHPALEMARPMPGSQSVDWLTSVALRRGTEHERDWVMAQMDDAGIETRPVFPPLHHQPIYRSRFARSLPVAERLAALGLSLPSGAGLSVEQIDRVVERLLQAISEAQQMTVGHAARALPLSYPSR